MTLYAKCEKGHMDGGELSRLFFSQSMAKVMIQGQRIDTSLYEEGDSGILIEANPTTGP